MKKPIILYDVCVTKSDCYKIVIEEVTKKQAEQLIEYLSSISFEIYKIFKHNENIF
jgi:hypothetical protein